ncbi:MAG: hypothetical protein K0S68_625 [Candidatus Saccharibacteria bacterium]|jgi:hypothetical protein|nr:hypothetical protein [Candidatus Saccharibacteria bacterium]
MKLRLAIVASLISLLLVAPGAAQAAAADLPYESLPRFTNNPVGERAQPISFIYVGTEAEVSQAFYSAGWLGADPATPSNLLRAYRAAKADAPYPTAPFSPAFIGTNKHDLAFQMATSNNTIHERHHTRLWDSGAVTNDGRPIWVGTASYDDDIATLGRTRIPVHSIDPNIDEERQFIVGSLGLPVEYVQIVEPQSGKNALGDDWYTDGVAAVIEVPALSGRQTTYAAPASSGQSATISSYTPASSTTSYSSGALDRFSAWLERTADRAGLPSNLF